MNSIRSTALAAILAGGIPVAASAQTPPPPPPPLPYGPPISLETAKACVAAARTEAAKNQWFMVVTVVDSGGHEVLTERMDNTQFGSIKPAEQKARSAVSFRRSTKFFEDMIAQGGATLRILRLDGVLPIEGGLPLVRDGAIIGGVGASGGTAQQDGVVAGACVTALEK